MKRALGAACAIALSLVVRAPAQSPAERQSINALRDSLRQMSDSGELRSLEKKTQAAVKASPKDALSLVRLGFVQLRRGEVVAERGRFSNAGSNFNDAVALHPDWPMAYTGRALARLNLADNETVFHILTPAFVSGDPVGAAAADFAQGAVLDSTYIEGLLKVTGLALRYRHAAQLNVALAALHAVAGSPVAHNPAVQLARVRIELIVGLPEAAAAAGRDLLAGAPNSAAALIEDGRARLALRDASGAEEWYRGIATADAATAAYYRADLVAVLPDSVLSKYDRAEGASRADVLRHFFEVHDPGSMATATERLAEHYVRLERARANFTIHTDVYAADIPLPYALSGREMDERGLVWVLHGVPTNRTYLNFTGGPKNESWQYARPDGGEFLFHFVKTSDSIGYRRVASLMDVIAMSKAARATGQSNVQERAANGQAVETYGAGWVAQTAQDVLYSRETTSPTYARMLSEGKKGAVALQAAERAVGDSSMAHGETSRLHYELPLEARVTAVAVGTEGKATALQVAFAIPGTSLYSPATATQVVYPIRMRLRVARNDSVILNIDTLRNFLAREPIPENGVLYGRLPVSLRPGNYQVYVALETAYRGIVVPAQAVRVAGDVDSKVDLSDLAIGARSVRLPWRTSRGDSVWINPSEEFRHREPMQVYFEVFGIPSGTSYRTAYVITREGDDRPQVQFSGTAVSGGNPDPIHREIDLGRLGAGTYSLQVTVSTSNSQPVVRRREFVIVK